MILLFDCGNTNIKIGLAKDHKIEQVFRINSVTNKTPDMYAIRLNQMFDPKQITGVIIASVVPEITINLKILSKRLYGIEPIVLEPGTKTGINIKADHPQEVGADLICGAAALIDPKPTVIVDLGTANKYLYVKNKTLLGVIISPGVVVSIKALVGSTALLPHVEIKVPKKVLGNNTVECMQSGVIYGVASEVEGIVHRIQKEIQSECDVIITGGLAKLISPLVDLKMEVRPNLVLEGLLNIYYLNTK
ncbi:MAG: type III pantothenate kinase [Acholeplasmataceae bacterium]|jgi:type III pantothenate kinase